jgi:hypothetical protein
VVLGKFSIFPLYLKLIYAKVLASPSLRKPQPTQRWRALLLVTDTSKESPRVLGYIFSWETHFSLFESAPDIPIMCTRPGVCICVCVPHTPYTGMRDCICVHTYMCMLLNTVDGAFAQVPVSSTLSYPYLLSVSYFETAFPLWDYINIWVFSSVASFVSWLHELLLTRLEFLSLYGLKKKDLIIFFLSR